jgi:Zn-dependent alcohol dehydrogenase
VLTDVQLASPQPNEVLLKVVACGLCHTDLCIQNGMFPTAFPSIAGHEGSGIVVAVGSEVTRVKEGDSVLLSFSSCQSCGYCESGHPAGCTSFVELNFGVRLVPGWTRLTGRGADLLDVHPCRGEGIPRWEIWESPKEPTGRKSRVSSSGCTARERS